MSNVSEENSNNPQETTTDSVESTPTPTQPDGSGFTRRAAIGGAIGALAVGAIGGTLVGENMPTAKERAGIKETGSGTGLVEFYGPVQAGITTPMQDRAQFAAFNVIAKDVEDIKGLLQTWTDAIADVMAGRDIGERGAYSGHYDAPPQDTGEAVGLPPSNLSVTVGFGRSLFVTPEGEDRFGLKDKLPEALIDLPHFPADNINWDISDGDIIVQACADDPQIAVHAVRNLARIGRGVVEIKWSSLGFGRTSSTTPDQLTPRNLLGFKDGTKSIRSNEVEDLDTHTWHHSEDWMDGGTFMIFRKIRMHIETWDRTIYREQEEVFGRTKREGAPLTGGKEFDEPDFDLKRRDGTPIMMVDSHVTLVHPKQNSGVRLLRRSYNYTDGADKLGRFDAGLLFIAFVTDPRTHYVPMQMGMSSNDQLMEYIQFNSNGCYAIPPGVKDEHGYIGETLFG